MGTPPINEAIEDLFPYIPQDSWTYLSKAQDKKLSEVYPGDDQRYHDEQEHLVQVLESQGVQVRRPDQITFPIVATTQCYARDPIVAIGNKLIVTNMNFEGRRQECQNYTRIALDLAKHYNGEVVMMPPNRPGMHPDNAYLEGGDVFVDGNDVYVGMTGNATNDKGIEWLRQELGETKYRVHKVPLHKSALHLDCAVMLINDNQGIICKDEFVDFDALPPQFKNRQWIEVKPKQAQLMATNGIVINPKKIIMIDHFEDVIQRVRDELQVDVITVPFQKSNYFGGGLRCSYQPIIRRSED